MKINDVLLEFAPGAGGEELDESVDEGAMATLGDDPWGPPGNFAGDKKIDVGPVSMRRIRVGDTVKYFGEKAQVVQINPATDYARISAGGKTLNVRLSDLKQLGQGMAEGLSEMDNRTPSGDRREQRANSPEAKAQREKEQQERLKKVSPEMRKKLGLPEPKELGVAEGSLNEFAPGNGDDGNGVPDNDFVYISKNKVADFEDWMESEGFDTDVPKTVKGRFVVYDYSGHDTMTIGYAKDWDEYESGLEEGKPQEKEADYGADYQDMVARVKKLAGLGPLKTVYDPQKRVYRNVPRAEQPKK
jgi:hypothetical protein